MRQCWNVTYDAVQCTYMIYITKRREGGLIVAATVCRCSLLPWQQLLQRQKLFCAVQPHPLCRGAHLLSSYCAAFRPFGASRVNATKAYYRVSENINASMSNPIASKAIAACCTTRAWSCRKPPASRGSYGCSLCITCWQLAKLHFFLFNSLLFLRTSTEFNEMSTINARNLQE